MASLKIKHTKIIGIINDSVVRGRNTLTRNLSNKIFVMRNICELRYRYYVGWAFSLRIFLGPLMPAPTPEMYQTNPWTKRTRTHLCVLLQTALHTHR